MSASSRRSRGRSRTTSTSTSPASPRSSRARARRHGARAVEPGAADLAAGRRALARRRSTPRSIALGPAVPISRRSRIGVPVGVRANLSLALEPRAIRRRPRLRARPAEPLVPRAPRRAGADRRDVPLAGAARLPARARAARAAARTRSTRSSRRATRPPRRRPQRFPGRLRGDLRRRRSRAVPPGRKRKLIVVEWRPTERAARARRPARARASCRTGSSSCCGRSR